mmetsp:Transcript_37412/g.60095  ORF Transcript_37412/g.60095 Transcript_37412/m.60095 type:complete len:194 (-) Transcript_37412:133-714(-)
MLAPLAQVLIALVEAGFLDKELLALGADSRAGVGLVAVAIQVTLDGDPLKRVKSRGGRVSFDGANKSAKKIGRSEVKKARCAREKRRVRHVDCGSGGGVLDRGQTADFACDEVGWERTKTEHNFSTFSSRRSLKTPPPEPHNHKAKSWTRTPQKQNGMTYPLAILGVQHDSDWYSRHCFTSAPNTSLLDTSLW